MTGFDHILHRANGTLVELNSQVGTFRAVTSERLTAVRQDVSSAELTLVSSEAFTVNVGDWIQAKGIRLYCMSTIDKYTCSEDNNREYQLTFYSPEYYLRLAIFYNTSESVNEGIYSYSRVDNTYPSVGTFEDFVKLCCYNCNSVQGERMFKVGTVSEDIATDIRVITFSDYNCLAVMKQSCESFETTWKVRINEDPEPDSVFIIDFGAAIDDFPVTLKVEHSQGLTSIDVTASDKDVYTQFVIKGGSENLPSDYPYPNLQLDEDPSSTPPILANSMIKLPDLYSRWGKSIKELTYEDIKPSRTGTVTSISENILKFTDSDLIGADWSPVGGTVHFVSGHLIGFTFNCQDFNSATGEITIESTEESNGFVLPSTTDSYYRINELDKYNIAGVSLPSSYITAAKTALKERALLGIDYWSQPRMQYAITIDPKIISVEIVPNMGFHIEHSALGIDKVINVQQVVYDLSKESPYDIESITVSDWTTDDSRADTLHRRIALAQALATKKQQKGDPGEDGLSINLGNYSQSIPCNSSGNASAAMTITIPFWGYRGANKVACSCTSPAVGATLVAGVTVSSVTNATESAAGSIVLSVASNATFGASATRSGVFNLVFSVEGETITLQFGWSKAVAGSTGAAGKRVVSGLVYYQLSAATAPAAPTASAFNFSDNTFTGLTANWALTPPVFEAGNANKFWYAGFYVEESASGSGTGVPAFSSVKQAISFSGLVTFTGDNTVTDGDKTLSFGEQGITQINGNKITTGKIAAERIDVDNLTAKKVSTDVDANGWFVTIEDPVPGASESIFAIKRKVNGVIDETKKILIRGSASSPIIQLITGTVDTSIDETGNMVSGFGQRAFLSPLSLEILPTGTAPEGWIGLKITHLLDTDITVFTMNPPSTNPGANKVWKDSHGYLKIGDGAAYAEQSHNHTKNQITDFPSSMPASDVSAWAKAATKPSYSASEVGASASNHSHNEFAGVSEVTTLVSVPITYRSVSASINTTAKGTISLASALPAGKELMLHIVASAALTVSFASTTNITFMDDENWSMASGDVIEISIWCYKADYYSVSSKVRS